MNKFMNSIEKHMYPLAEWVQSNKYLASIQHGLMMAMPLLMVGAFAAVIGELPITAYQNFMESILGPEIWGSWNWDVINVATMGLTGIIALVGTSYELARRNDTDPLPGVAVAFMSYFILLHLGEDGGVLLSDLGAQSLFLSILVSIIATEIYKLCIKNKWTIKMPESVPSFVSNQFAALVPATICAIFFLIVRYAISTFSGYDTAFNLVYQLIQAPLTNMGTSLPGTLVATFVNSALWLFGIHGTSVVEAVMQPVWYAARAENLAIYNASVTALRPYIVTQDFSNMVIFLSGTGITLPLTLQMMFMCKSERIKAIGKISVIPGIFNVNEPVIFGLPLVMNPVMIVPFFLAPIVAVVLAYGSMTLGIVPYPTGITIPWTMPAPFGGWLMTGSWTGGLLQIVIFVVSGIIYYPFIKTLDNKYVIEEAENAKQNS